MCPACMATVALIPAGATSAGGLTALAAKTFRAKTTATDMAPTTFKEGEQDGPPENRVTS